MQNSPASPGEQFIERDKSGHELPAYRGQVIEPQHGSDVHLTIDMQLQDNVEAICERAWKANKARRVVIVVTEPATGTVLAMAARPHRDPEQSGCQHVDQPRHRRAL
jgi:cell division protein FtsI/penicillin-binding protein 2